MPISRSTEPATIREAMGDPPGPDREASSLGRSSQGTNDSDAAVDRLTPDRIIELGYGFWRSKALLTAVEIGLFTMLADGPLDLEFLTARLGLHRRGARDFFDALVALGLLERDAEGRYANQPDCALYLDRRRPTYIGGPLEHLNARLYHSWGRLTEALHTGLPQSGTLATGGYRALYADDAAGAMFLRGMTGGGLIAAQALAEKFPWHLHRTIIDVGTAEGCVVVEIACAHPVWPKN